MCNLRTVLYLSIAFLILAASRQNADAQIKGRKAWTDSVITILPNAAPDTNKANLLLQLSEHFIYDDAEAGMKYGRQALALAEKLHWNKGIILSHIKVGWYYGEQGSRELALAHGKKAYALAAISGNIGLQIDVDAFIAAIYMLQENIEMSIITLERALAADKKYGPFNFRTYINMYFDLAGVYKAKGDTNAGVRIHKEALAAAEKEKNPIATTICLSYLANDLTEMGDYPGALEYESRAEKLAQGPGREYALAGVHSGYADIYGRMKEYDKAIGHYVTALDMYEKSKYSRYTYETHIEIGKLLVEIALNPSGNLPRGQHIPGTRKGILVKAASHFRKSIQVGEETQTHLAIMEGNRLLSETESLLGDPASALASYKQYILLRDSTDGDEKTKKLTQQLAEFQFSHREDSMRLQQQATTQRLQRKQTELESEQQKRYYYLAGILVLAGFAGLAVRSYRIQRRSNRLLGIEQSRLSAEKNKSEALLLNILPEEVAQELKDTGGAQARHFDEVSVLFTDFVNFTEIAEKLSPQELVQELHTCFSAFDAIISTHGLEKIKTIGDAYLAVSGLPVANPKHAHACVEAGIEIRDYITKRKAEGGPFEIRIGIYSGPVVAGIVGVKKFAYDIWGDTVNTAARMEQHSEAGQVNISQATYELVKEEFGCSARGKVAAKNKGNVEMYFVGGARVEVEA